MNILVIVSSWNDQNAVGNTYSNWFGGNEWSDDQFACICTRLQKPSNSVCKLYYRFTDIEILKKYLCSHKIGHSFIWDCTEPLHANDSDVTNERRLVESLHRKPNHFIYYVQEKLRLQGKWVNQNLIDFLKEFKPDIIFTTANGICMPKDFVQYIRMYTQAQIVLYISDDMLGKYKTFPWYRRRAQIRGFEYAIESADLIFGASKLLCEEYQKQFDVQITPLYKGCEITQPIKKKTNSIVRFVYAGNLFYGRADTLAVLASAIEQLNQTGMQATLEIYTGTTVSPEIEKKLNLGNSSRIMGLKPYSEIKEIQNQADIILHVESFDQEQIDYVHYSFSTKIMDCLQSGSGIWAIGPSGIASIEYFRNIPGARVTCNLAQLPKTVEEILLNKESLLTAALQSRNFAIEKHDIHTVRAELKQAFSQLLKEG